MTTGSCELPCVHRIPLGCREEEAGHPAHRHILHPFLSLDAANGENSSPASPPCADHWKQLQAQHPSSHLEIRRNGLRAASFPSTNSRSKCQNSFLPPCCKPQTRPLKLLHRQVRNKPPLGPCPSLFTGRVNIHRQHSGEGDKAGAAS